ncbi:MAG: non-heme iron oxygenase ferredoxin subunit [Planctomycetia bacterium]|nr:non-heme iron oxygenase ferredoxin subunit [Planctomycetia bacterium]
MAKTVKVAQTSDIAPGTGKVVQADGRSIALFNVDGSFVAIDNTCTHRGGPLGEGGLTGDTVECPWHGAQFNVKTGAVTKPPAQAGVRSFPVKVEGSDVVVEVD